MRVNAPGLTVKDIWDAQTATYGAAGSYSKLIEDYVDAKISLAKADLTTLETRISAARAILLDNLDAPVAATVAALLDELAKDHTTAGSIAELLKWALGDVGHLCDHFEARTIADLPIPYTETVVGGGTVNVYVDDLPSAVRLSTGAVEDDAATLASDRTVSLLGLGGTKLVAEFKAKVNTEGTIYFALSVKNETTDLDLIGIILQTDGGAPRATGCLQCWRDGANEYTAMNLTGAYDLTTYHKYRLEITPGTRVDAYVDESLVASEETAAEVPLDQSFVVEMSVKTLAAADRILDVDYWKVWSE